MLVAVSSQMTSSRLIWGLLKPIMVLYIYIYNEPSLSLFKMAVAIVWGDLWS